MSVAGASDEVERVYEGEVCENDGFCRILPFPESARVRLDVSYVLNYDMVKSVCRSC